ncbi:NAD(P)-dependent oxidoreductase [Yinghuangia seranimata]|uniref:NAD(P)-dependent oxidoreductase n=1 Tax=Yinghuangia seranimata TaxID=408067 RepID=UPI00248ABE22|nr:NAD(P)-dependent oxidoreductase [Yinghuangia seranimata]MDI2132723.1 NAD(P)-dependent oxidoreductase [Yinghuangia seranimata]
MAEVAVIGVGAIGGGAARALLDAGHHVTVHDARAEALAAFDERFAAAPTLADVAAGGPDAVVVAVFDDAQVLAVLTGADGLLAGLPPDSVVLVVSTISTGTLDALHAAAAELPHTVHLVDCGVTGGPAAARDGRLVAMLGGTDAAVARALPVAEAFSSRVVPMGGPGSGLRAKLIRNHMQYGVWAVADEARRLAEAAGIDVARLKEIVVAGDELTGGPTALLGPRPADPEFMRGPAAMAHKDLKAAIELADAVGAEVPHARLAEPTYERVFGIEDPAPEPDGSEASEPDLRAVGLAKMAEVLQPPDDAAVRPCDDRRQPVPRADDRPPLRRGLDPARPRRPAAPPADDRRARRVRQGPAP